MAGKSCGIGRIGIAVSIGLAAFVGQIAPSQVTAASRPKARIIAFSDSFEVPTAPELQKDLSYFSGTCGKATSGSLSFASALSHARALVAKAGSAAVKKVETGPDANPQRAEVDAAGAMADDNPVGALAALLSAYDHDKSNPVHLRNIGGILADLEMPKEALAFLAKADTLKSKPQSPMGISDADSEANNRAYADMELGRFSQAASLLQPLVKRDATLSEAKTNLGMVQLCLGKPAQAATMMAAAARRNSFPKTDTTGVAPDAVTQAPVSLYLDMSHGYASTLPYLDYPKSVKEVEDDGSSYWAQAADGTVVQHFYQLMNSDSTQETALMSKVLNSKLAPAERMRIMDLESAMQNASMGGYKSLEDAAWKAQDTADGLMTDVFSGQCGLACQKMQSIEQADPNGNYCTDWWPQMSPWITNETQQWAADMQTEDTAWRKQWSAQSKWATAVIANISNKNANKAMQLLLDTTKQSDMYLLTSDIGAWERSVALYDLGMKGLCPATTSQGPQPPADTKTKADDCPKTLKDHALSFSVGILSVSTDCESISVRVSDELLGPFAQVTFTQAGNVTITMGAQAGVSMGPMSAGVEAGVYVTVGPTGFTDAGVEANASTSASVGSVQMSVGQAQYTGSFIDSSSTPGSFSQ